MYIDHTNPPSTFMYLRHIYQEENVLRGEVHYIRGLRNGLLTGGGGVLTALDCVRHLIIHCTCFKSNNEKRHFVLFVWVRSILWRRYMINNNNIYYNTLIQ